MLEKFGLEIKTWKSNHLDIGRVDIHSKVLGIHWNAKEDMLSVSFRKINKSPKISKTRLKCGNTSLVHKVQRLT